MSPYRLLGLCALLTLGGALGCARSAADPDVVEPDTEEIEDEIEDEPEASEPEASEPDASEPDASEPEAAASDPGAEHITFDGPDAEPGPSDQVVAPPQRPPMPSMMTDVLKTGPRL